jgi:hypothetical protein
MKLSFFPKLQNNGKEQYIKYIHSNPGFKWMSYIPIQNKPIQK